jgi:hypothetical protein
MLVWQVVPPMHAVAHMPQLPLSFVVLTQRPAHTVCPVGQ